MNKLVTPDTGSLVPVGADDDPFAVVFVPAKPALDAALKLQPLFAWLERHYQNVSREFLPLLDVKRAQEHKAVAFRRCAAIPEDAAMYQNEELFRSAECEAAPEAWLHAAIGLMLDSMPNAKNVSPSYRYGLVDSMLRDPEVWGGYRPGFSYPVIAQVAREVRRMGDFAPSQAEFLKLCGKHRSSVSIR